MVGKYKNQNKGIYKILNTVNNKCYIGSTIQGFSLRWSQHRTELYRNIHTNPYLQNAWNKYGKEAFVFIEQERLNNETDINKIRKREQYWLDNLQPEYNLSSVASYGDMSELGKYKLGYAKGLKAELISPKGIHYCSLSLAWFAEDFNLNAGTLQDLCNGKIHHHKKWKGSIILENGETPYLNTEKPNAKIKYILINPEGIKSCTDNIKEFCAYNNLQYSHMCNTANPNSLRKQHKDWSAIKVEDLQKEEYLQSLEENKQRIARAEYITYIWNTKTDKAYIIGDIENNTHLTLYTFCKEFNLSKESIRTAFNKGKHNYKHFVIYREYKDKEQPAQTFLSQYYLKHKDFKIRKQRSCPYIYTAVSPQGIEYTIEKDTKGFCEQHNLDSSSFLKVAKGTLKSVKGWKVSRQAKA